MLGLLDSVTRWTSKPFFLLCTTLWRIHQLFDRKSIQKGLNHGLQGFHHQASDP
jgi:hypothetical protein